MRFLQTSDVRQRFEGKRVAIVGSGPGVLDNEEGFIDSHEVVVRVNNYRICLPSTGMRCDAHYSFYGHSIRKTICELITDGVTLCMCKCPNAVAIESEWHRRRRKLHGVDFRWIYQERAKWWFCDTYVPPLDRFLLKFEMLGRHVPTTGFAAIIDILSFEPAALYLTGFDFFRSGKHNVNEPWREKNTDDPIGHVPERELLWLKENFGSRMSADRALTQALETARVCA